MELKRTGIKFIIECHFVILTCYSCDSSADMHKTISKFSDDSDVAFVSY